MLCFGNVYSHPEQVLFQFHAFLDLNNKLMHDVCLMLRSESKLAWRTGVFSRIGMSIHSRCDMIFILPKNGRLFLSCMMFEHT